MAHNRASIFSALSALGQKQTYAVQKPVVRFTPNSGHGQLHRPMSALCHKQTWQLPTTLFWWDHFNPAQTVFLDELLKHPGSFHMIQGLGQIREASRISFRDCNTR